MMGTSWITRTALELGALSRSLKALPQPGEMYRQNELQSSGLISWTSWADWEKRHSTDALDIRNAKTAVNSAVVFADVQAIAREFSASEIIVKQRGADGLEDVDNHPLEMLWQSPNQHMGRSYLMEFWAWSYALLGKAYLYWIPSGGQLREVWPVPPGMIIPAKDDRQFIKGYWFKASINADPVLIPPQYITFSRSVNPFDPMDGMSALVAGMVDIKGDIAAAAWNLNFFGDQNGIPDGLITVPKDTLDADLMRIRAEIRDFFGGTRRGVAVARAGDLDYKPFGRTQKDAEFLQGREFASRTIGRLFGLPDGYWSERANRANAEQARSTMISGAVWPMLVRLAEDLNAQLVPRWYSADERVEFKDIRPENRELKLQEQAAAKDVMTIDELRQRFWDMEEIGDVRGGMLVAEIVKGTPTPASAPSQETEDYISQQEQAAGVNQPDAGAESAPPEGEPPPPAEEGAPPGVEGEAMPPEQKSAEDLALWQTKALNTLRKKGRATCVFNSDTLDDATKHAIALALSSARTPSEVRAVFAPFSVKAAPDLKSKLSAILARAQQEAADAIERGDEPDIDALSAQLSAALHKALVAEVKTGVDTQATALGVTPSGISAAPWAATYVPELIKDLNATTQADLQRVISAYRATPGMTRQDVIDALAGTFGESRADMIAQTETTRAASQAAVSVNDYLRGQGLDYQYVWHTNNDERTCDLCGPLDGQVVDADNLPPKHPRCRCSVGQTLKR